MKKLGLCAAFVAALSLACGHAASADDLPIPTKAPPPLVSPALSATCGSLYDFFLTACPLSWSGVTLYGTVDVGGTYQTHGTPFDPNFPTGASYLLGAGGSSATNRTPGFGLGPNALSQSVLGVKSIEPLAPGWDFVSVNELAFDPYSLLLANAPQAMQDGKAVPQDLQAIPADSSRWGWLAGQNAIGVKSANYGTLTFGRQNVLELDGINAYDPMGGSYAFSPLGFSGKTAGAGNTEDARWTTAIKYRENIGDFRFSIMGQPVGGNGSGLSSFNPNDGAISGGIGGDVKHLGSGILSLDVIGTFERDAVNITDSYGCNGALPQCGALGPAQVLVNGFPTTFPGAFLKATLSNNTAFMALAKYSFGSWAPAPVVGKAPPSPSPSGVPLTLYAGYEWIQFANPSDPQNSLRDDGFLFSDPTALTAAGHGQTASTNLTAINNNAFNANCGTGGGCTDEIFQIMWAGAKYGITKDLDVITAFYHYIQNQYTLNAGNVCAVAAQHSQCAGYFDMASLVFDWRFLPKWDAYIGTMYSAAFGGLASGDIVRNNVATTAGVRFRF
jgi:Gram-negative porin